ncbi:hypothetical protein [Ensifer aridi]|uniref:hypothetical protein n=1 Tax=Ensifer aridi TaxID=1708715 RepID=UPI000A111BAC|nr:hypothetical protein [Ensifer aridi]
MNVKVESPKPPVDNIPPAEASALGELERRIADLEQNADLAELSAEARHRDLLISEIKQRIRMRYAAFGISIVAMAFMGYVLGHGVHTYFWGPFVLVPQAVAIAMFIGPVASITTITIMLLIGAFRRFKDDDVDHVNVPSLAAEAAKTGFGGS